MDGLEIEIVEHFGKVMKVRKKLSIVIVNYNVKEYLKRCLESILRSEPYQGNISEVFVVDNHSQDSSVEMIKSEFPQVYLISNQKNFGFAKACNQGIREAKEDYILLLNPDTIFPEKGFEKAIVFMEENSDVGILGCKIKDQKGRLLYSARSFRSLSTSISSSHSVLNRIFPGNPLSKRYLLKDLDHSRPAEVDWVSGSCLLARKQMLEQIGLLDERYFMYVEDVDLCYRAKGKGWKVFYFPGILFVHFLGRSTSQNKLNMQLEHHRSMYLFYRKHFSASFFLRFLVLLGICLRLVFVSLGFFIYKWR